MDTPVRVRYAPSPTGFPHVGNIRTALFNWLYARHTGGKFIVRIEDTDVARTVPGAVEAILDSLRWLGLDWDEGPEVNGPYGPYFQSRRLSVYQEVAERLVKEDYAYYCYCSSERLESMRAEQQRQNLPTGYDRHCRLLSRDECKQKEAAGVKPVVRFKTPLEGQTRFQDLLRGEVIFENSLLDDFVLLKSDGYPTYHLANIIDDHLMQISHVLRAEEWLSSTPRHIMLYNALGFNPPQFAHLPMILGPDRSKLSKRHGATALTDYRDQGYLPETILNFLTLLGWSLDENTEIFNRQELIDNFSLERVSRTAAIFNKEKLDWMNGVYIRGLRADDLTSRVLPFMEKDFPPEINRPLDINYVRQIVPLIRERIITLKDAATYADFFFLDKLEYDSAMLIGKKMSAEISLTALKAAQEKLSSLESFSPDLLEDTLRHLADDLGMKTGQLLNPLRVATTGRDAAPPIFETMAVLGKERCLNRIKAALAKLADN
jgi:glutamyl-tRNA synthetase